MEEQSQENKGASPIPVRGDRSAPAGNRDEACSFVLGSTCRTGRVDALRARLQRGWEWRATYAEILVQPGGLEPPTFGATIRRSNQLSYGCTGRAWRGANLEAWPYLFKRAAAPYPGAAPADCGAGRAPVFRLGARIMIICRPSSRGSASTFAIVFSSSRTRKRSRRPSS
jgi:hypothetical protein